jgi:hypothetical protein
MKVTPMAEQEGLVEQVIRTLMEKLRTRPEMDADTLKALAKLGEEGKLSDVSAVQGVLRQPKTTDAAS